MLATAAVHAVSRQHAEAVKHARAQLRGTREAGAASVAHLLWFWRGRRGDRKGSVNRKGECTKEAEIPHQQRKPTAKKKRDTHKGPTTKARTHSVRRLGFDHLLLRFLPLDLLLLRNVVLQ